MNALDAISQAKDVITVRRVYGDPYQEHGITIIPAASVMGGGGGGGDTAGNGGGGFGVRARPAGAWVIKNGEAEWRPAIDLNRTILVGQLVAIVALLVARSIVKTLAKARREACNGRPEAQRRRLFPARPKLCAHSVYPLALLLSIR